MITSLGERGDSRRLEEIGFAGYLIKPVRQGQLRDMLAVALGRVAQPSDASGTSILTRDASAEPSVRRMRVLVAEDNATNQLVALKMLEKLGLRSDVVADGQEALAALRHIPYDLVLMDCQMPEMDGFEATWRMRQGEAGMAHISTPVIAMTAHAMHGDRKRCLEAGMNDYLAKPVNSVALAGLLERWLVPGADAVQGDGDMAVETAASGPAIPVFDRSALSDRLTDNKELDCGHSCNLSGRHSTTNETTQGRPGRGAGGDGLQTGPCDQRGSGRCRRRGRAGDRLRDGESRQGRRPGGAQGDDAETGRGVRAVERGHERVIVCIDKLLMTP